MTPEDEIRRTRLRRAHSQAQEYRRMGSPVPEWLRVLEREYWADYERSHPGRGRERIKWFNRTVRAAQAELVRRHQEEYTEILREIRQQDPRPEAEEATDAAA